MGMDMATDALPARCRAPRPRLRAWLAPLALALGPAVIGLCADNDAGGMLSYVVTGASHGLAWLLPALVLLGAPTCFVMWVSLRVAEATRQPYSKVLATAVGRPVARAEALGLYALNALILVTEFVGMTLALSLLGLPRAASAALTLGLVVVLTGSRTYPRIEQLLLRVAVGNLAFLPALLLSRHAPGAVAAAFSLHPAHARFLLLALAGNTLAPWMIYWQQNAVWAGDPRSPRQRRTDLLAGQAAMIAMASAVLLLGGLVPGTAASWASPVAWIFHDGGRAAGILFAVGLFDAGLLAACTISLSSLWTLREALGHGAAHPSEAPNRGPWQAVHLGTLGAAAAVVLWPGLAAGPLALWAQALGALWLPVSLILLSAVAGSRRVRPEPLLGLPVRAALWAMAGGYVVLAYLGLGGRA